MIEANITRALGALTTITNGRHSWTSDIPKAYGSHDAAPDPHDLLDSALAACTVLTLELYLRRKPDWSVSHLCCKVERLREEKDVSGRVHYRVKRIISAEGALSSEQKDKLREIANKCPIHLLMEGQIEVETEVAV